MTCWPSTSPGPWRSASLEAPGNAGRHAAQARQTASHSGSAAMPMSVDTVTSPAV